MGDLWLIVRVGRIFVIARFPNGSRENRRIESRRMSMAAGSEINIFLFACGSLRSSGVV